MQPLYRAPAPLAMVSYFCRVVCVYSFYSVVTVGYFARVFANPPKRRSPGTHSSIRPHTQPQSNGRAPRLGRRPVPVRLRPPESHQQAVLLPPLSEAALRPMRLHAGGFVLLQQLPGEHPIGGGEIRGQPVHQVLRLSQLPAHADVACGQTAGAGRCGRCGAANSDRGFSGRRPGEAGEIGASGARRTRGAGQAQGVLSDVLGVSLDVA